MKCSITLHNNYTKLHFVQYLGTLLPIIYVFIVVFAALLFCFFFSSHFQSFSISRIVGAFCDEGQNYKNLVGFVKGLEKDYSDKIVFGCAKDF